MFGITEITAYKYSSMGEAHSGRWLLPAGA